VSAGRVVLLAGVVTLVAGCPYRPCPRERGFGHQQCRRDTFLQDTGEGYIPPPNTTGTATTPTDTDPWGTPGVGGENLGITWSSDGVIFVVGGTGATSIRLGMAETRAGVDGWYGEDCLTGVCHAFTPPQMTLATVATEGEVVAGQTTLFTQALAYDADGDRLTYMIALDGGPHDGLCVVFGDDTAYYGGLGCEVWVF
jgi:hypothetical protein